MAKPDPAIFRYALRHFGAPASACVYIGDNLEKDIKPARELGMKVIHFDPRGRRADADARDAQQLWSRIVGTLELPQVKPSP